MPESTAFVYVLPHTEHGYTEWHVQKAAPDYGPVRVGDGYATKGQAVTAGRDLAMSLKTELVVHRKNGTFQYRNSYGGDSRRRPGAAPKT